MKAVTRGVGVAVAVPVFGYFVLVWAGAAPVWALVGSAAVSVVVLLFERARAGRWSTLGALVLFRFALGVLAAFVTGDPRVVLAKDCFVTLAVAVIAAASVATRRPLIARIRRELVTDPATFDRQWLQCSIFQRVHTGLTWMWVGGLCVEVAVACTVIGFAPLSVAVVATAVLSPLVVIGLITGTEVLARRIPARECEGAACDAQPVRDANSGFTS